MADSDKPNTCAVTRSLVFVMTWIPAVGFCVQQGKARARLGAHTRIHMERSTIEWDAKLYVSAIRRYENGWDLASRSLRPRTTPPERRRLSRRGFQTNQRSLAKALLAALRPPSPRQLISSSTLHPTVNNSAQNWPQEVVTGAAAPRLWHDL